MSHIVEFAVAGLAGRKKPYVKQLNRNINIFFGPNGSGKTSLLNILASAMSDDADILKDVPFETARVTVHSDDYGRTFKKTIKRTSAGTRQRRKTPARERSLKSPESDYEVHELKDQGAKLEWNTEGLPPDKRKGGWTHTFLPTWRIHKGRKGIGRRFHSKAEVGDLSARDWDTMFAEGLQSLWSNYSAEVISKVQKIQGDGLVSILQGIFSKKDASKKPRKLDVEKAYDRVSAFLVRQGSAGILGPRKAFAERYYASREIRKVVDDINRIELRIDRAQGSRRKLKQLIQRMFVGAKHIRFLEHTIEVADDFGGEIGLSSLSSGEKQVLGLFIETLLIDQSSLIIDEPDLSLHVDWQKRLISDMRILNPRAQLIVATHSPEIMAHIKDDLIFGL